MLYTKPDFIYKQIEEKNLIYFMVLDGTALIGEQQNEEFSADKTIELLKQCLDSIDGSGFVLVKLSGKSRQKKAAEGRDWTQHTYNVKINGGGASTAINGFADGNSSLMQEIAALKVQLVENEYKHQLAQLQEQINGLKETKSDPIADYAVTLLSKYMEANPAQKPIVGIAGMEQQAANSVSLQEDDKTRFVKVIERLKKLDSDYITTLEKLAAFSEKNPTQYKMYLNML